MKRPDAAVLAALHALSQDATRERVVRALARWVHEQEQRDARLVRRRELRQ